jgi:hypothetical protein
MNDSQLSIVRFASDAAELAADRIEAVIQARAAQGRLALIAFDADVDIGPGHVGSVVPGPIQLVLEALAARVQAGTLSLANLAAIPVWDWWPAGAAGKSARLRHFLQTRTDICGANIWSLEGGDRSTLSGFCSSIGSRIEELGGIDLALLAIWSKERLGQNESEAWPASRTRLVYVEHDGQPRRAITLGLADLDEAKQRVMIGTGRACANAASWVVLDHELHPNDSRFIILDHAAASDVDSIRAPWRSGPLREVGMEWSPKVIAMSGLAESDGDGLNFDPCHELLANFADVAPDQDPRPALLTIAQDAIRSAAKPLNWRSVLLVSRHADDAQRHLPGVLAHLAAQTSSTHTVCLHGALPTSALHTLCRADRITDWQSAISHAIARHRPDHIIAVDDVAGLLSNAALTAAAGQPIQVLCALGLRSPDFEWLFPAVTASAVQSNDDPGAGIISTLLDWPQGAEILAVVR